jgi:hypothetical protein
MVNNKIYLRRLVSVKVTPDDLYKIIIDMCKELHACVLGVEVTSLNNFIIQPLVSALRIAHLTNVEIVECSPTTDKAARAGGLISYYRQGVFEHLNDEFRILEDNLVQWPKPENWDEIDALVNIIKVLQQGGLYFDAIQQQSFEDQINALRERDLAMPTLPTDIYY